MLSQVQPTGPRVLERTPTTSCLGAADPPTHTGDSGDQSPNQRANELMGPEPSVEARRETKTLGRLGSSNCTSPASCSVCSNLRKKTMCFSCATAGTQRLCRKCRLSRKHLVHVHTRWRCRGAPALQPTAPCLVYRLFKASVNAARRLGTPFEPPLGSKPLDDAQEREKKSNPEAGC